MESVLTKLPSSRRGTKKVLSWLENHVTTDFCDCCHRMNVAFCPNNSITVVKHERNPSKTCGQNPRFQRNSVARKMIRRVSRAGHRTKVKPIQTPPSVQTSTVVSVSSAHELKTYMKNGYRCTLC